MEPSGYQPRKDGTVVPVYNTGTPGVAGAISDAIKAIMGALAPRSIMDRRANINQAVDQASAPAPQGQSLGDQF